MNADTVIDIYTALARNGIPIWIDGGWGVDALLERQTRNHSDLDIAVALEFVAALRALLEALGFSELPGGDASEWNFVLTDAMSGRIDVHVVVFDAFGNGILGPAKLGQMYPAGALAGTGRIGGTVVQCVTPAFVLKFKSSYAPREIDRQDVRALCEHFGLVSPFPPGAAS
jgi:lincosamide nucleotidyltransferase A/C/D/E